MAIIRVDKRDNPYVIIDKTGLNDDRLSFKAKGILAFLLSKPDNWYCHRSHLAKVGPDGETAVRSGLKELKEYGYLEKKPIKNEKGQIEEWQSLLREVPKSLAESQSDQKDENPPSGKATGCNSPQHNKEVGVNKELNKTSKKTHAREGANHQNQPQPVIAHRYQQIFNRILSDQFYQKMTRYYDNEDILMLALDIAEQKGDKPSYLLTILSDWFENGLKTAEGIKDYIQERTTESGNFGRDKVVYSKETKELLDGDKLNERSDWN